jgi:hypothetical protein
LWTLALCCGVAYLELRLCLHAAYVGRAAAMPCVAHSREAKYTALTLALCPLCATAPPPPPPSHTNICPHPLFRPFVMNSKEEILQAYMDYSAGRLQDPNDDVWAAS